MIKAGFARAVNYGMTIFLSAFLLFQIQPIIGKIILPWFGGSASVWTICILFFQTVLLCGYLYAHGTIRFLTPLQQSILHIALLIANIFLLPIYADESWKPTGSENPVLHILRLLTFTIGLPYFTLSATGPLLQAWYAREKDSGIPYKLFALSNFGSLIALLAYPVALEPHLPIRLQSEFWSLLFVLFILSCGALAWRSRKTQLARDATSAHGASSTIGFGTLCVWILLAACPSILVVANTSFLTENIAPVPMLWIATLALYLLSFVIVFERRHWYARKIFAPLFVIALGVLAYLPMVGLDSVPIIYAMPANLAAFFVVCMVCHGELAERQPDVRHLTLYYLMLAFGGFIGGLCVGVIAPYIFNDTYELAVGIVVTCILVSFVFLSQFRFRTRLWELSYMGVSLLFVLAISAMALWTHIAERSGLDLSRRSFYGTVKVATDHHAQLKTMFHGQIIHGRQSTALDSELEPTLYYMRQSGVGLAITSKQTQAPNIRVGAIGLGVGTIAAHGLAGDKFRFYEINSQVIDLAQHEFTFLSKSKAETELVLGDARLQLEREGPQGFDVLVVDAFSGDSIPVHLLTLEAFSLYLNHLSDDGILALHITNRFLDLMPVMKAAADHFGVEARRVRFEAPSGPLQSRSEWILMAKKNVVFDRLSIPNALPVEGQADFKPWTDDRSSLLSVLR